MTKMIRDLKMMNVSTLPLTTGLKLQQPFQIVLDDGSRVSETVSAVMEHRQRDITQNSVKCFDYREIFDCIVLVILYLVH